MRRDCAVCGQPDVWHDAGEPSSAHVSTARHQEGVARATPPIWASCDGTRIVHYPQTGDSAPCEDSASRGAA
jgi:hypothetical protein